MLVRPARCRRTPALCRLPSSYHKSLQSRSGSSLLGGPEPLQQHHLPATRRLLTTRQSLRPWKRRGSQTGIGYPPERSLATAISDVGTAFGTPFGETVLRGNPPSSPFPLSMPKTPVPLWELRSQDVSNPIVVCDSEEALTRTRLSTQAIPGDISELTSMFDACIRVGKIERAGLILRRLSKMFLANDLDPIEYHNAFFKASVDRLLQDPTSKPADNLHRWYELQIHVPGIEPTAETIALLVKASLITAKSTRLQRLVDRYMGMVPGDAGLEVLYMEDILTDQDRAKITSICQTYNLPSEPLTRPSPTEDDADIPFESAPLPTHPQPVASNNYPEVLETPQKSSGLRRLKETLQFFAQIPEDYDVAQLSPQDRREIQCQLERGCVDAAIGRWREENETLQKLGLNTSIGTASLNARLYDWQLALEEYIEKDLAKVEASEAAESKSQADYDRCLYGPILRQSSPSRLAAVTILSLLSSLSLKGIDNGVSLAAAVLSLATVVQGDIKLQIRAKEDQNRYKAAPKLGRARQTRLARHPASNGAPDGRSNTIDSLQYPDEGWPVVLRTKVGAILLSALLQTAKIDVRRTEEGTDKVMYQRQAAFTRMTQYKQGKKTGTIIPNEALVEMMKREPRGDVLARHLPMVVEPQPWKGFDKGGFLEYAVPLVRTKAGDKDQMIYAQAALARGDMDQLTKGLDVLGKTAWRVNNKVYSVMLEAWNKGDAFAGLPALNSDLPLPEEPAPDADFVERRKWLRQLKAVENEISGQRSVRCFNNLQMEIARSFRNQTFYFPHNLDFRGRAYPMSTYLNHMGADNVRGILMFAKGKELGEEGLRWLKVQLANVYGYDKASFDEREQFTTDNIDNVVDSANNPFDGKQWWLNAEDPWQCLAACFELQAALACPDPTKFVSHLPVHQDGTCNGLQHYAALGGDTWGAQQVNLAPGSRPADVYSAVAKEVTDLIRADAQKGVEFAAFLQDKITRKVVKQTVMTNVYGVTFEGARRQVKKQLDALYPKLAEENNTTAMHLAFYIAKKIFLAMGSMFRGAHDIQYWLGEIGGRVCTAILPDQIDHLASMQDKATQPKESSKKSKRDPNKVKAEVTTELTNLMRQTIVWTTPLRMPVAQPYRKAEVRTVHTCMQDLQLMSPDRTDPVDKRKQLQGFPPNFIHSLDASHMLLSALQCDELGLTFAAVHDSFWTHASDIKVLNKALRDSFVRIHSEDVIGRLASEFEARYRGAIYMKKIGCSTPLSKAIHKWRLKSATVGLKDELILEKKRQDLLNSSNPDRVAEGKAMVTPASIYEEMAEPWQQGKDSGDPKLETLAMDEAADKDVTDVETDDISSFDAAEGSIEGDLDAAAAGTSSEDVLDMDDLAASPDFANPLEDILSGKKKSSKGKGKANATTPIWLPLTFPEVPVKGDFDVSVLKGSQYFFS